MSREIHAEEDPEVQVPLVGGFPDRAVSGTTKKVAVLLLMGGAALALLFGILPHAAPIRGTTDNEPEKHVIEKWNPFQWGEAHQGDNKCGSDGNNAGPQMGNTLSADSSCACKALCESIAGCQAWTYSTGVFTSVDGAGATLNCWLRSSFEEVVDNCGGQCLSAPNRKEMKCGSDGNNNAAQMVNTPISSDSACDCMALCENTAGCGGWTYSAGTFTSVDSAGATLNCFLRSSWGSVTDPDNCNGQCTSGSMAEEKQKTINEVKDVRVQAAEYCRATDNEGNITWIAGNSFTGVEDWVVVDQTCYAALSVCLTSPQCDPMNANGPKDVRKYYPTMVGNANLGLAMSRLSNVELMDTLQRSTTGCTEDAFATTLSQIMMEIGMLQQISAFYLGFESFFDAVNSQMDVAFTSMLTLLAMPASTQIATPGVKWGKIVLDLVVDLGTVVAAVCSGGATLVVEGSIAATAYGVSAAVATGVVAAAEITQQSAEDAENNDGTYGSVTLTPEMEDLDASVLQYDKMVTLLMLGLDQVLVIISAQQLRIADNWGRLKAASKLAHACPSNPVTLQELALNAYGAMQWTALGLLMPSKYVIYYQRQYGGNKGPTCYWSNTGAGTGCSNLDMGCYSPAWTDLDTSYAYTCSSMGNDKSNYGEQSCFEANYDNDGTNCKANRHVWVGEVGNPSAGPSTQFWTGLGASRTGPISTFVNVKFGTTFAGAEGAWTAFVSSCAYMTKLYIPPIASGQVSHSATVASTVAVGCSVFGMPVKTYAFADCNTNLATNAAQDTLTGTCTNGFGQSSGAVSGDMWSSGNSNQYMYIPNKKGDWSSLSDGQVACCLPWLAISSMPSQCDYSLCDCFSLAQGGNNNWLNEALTGQTQQNGLWWGTCDVDTNTKSQAEMMTTSEGSLCDWTSVLESESNFQACAQNLGPPTTTPYPSWMPPVCSSASDCSGNDQCVGGKGIQQCNSCKSVDCTGNNGLSYCSCNGDSTNGIPYCSETSDCSPSDQCQGGHGAQVCSSCQKIQCSDQQCSCNGD